MSGGDEDIAPVMGGWPPDPLDQPLLFTGITERRVVAFLIDRMIVAMISIVIYLALLMLTVATLGLAAPLFVVLSHPLVGLAYHVLLIASPAGGTLGMRLMGLRAWSLYGGRPTGLQALLHGLGYYVSMGLTAGLISLVALFNRRRLTLHDMLAGVLVLREI